MRSELTPIQKVDGIYVKRDDLFTVAGVCGGKARSCWHIAKGASGGLVTASSRHSPQAVITAHIANSLGIDCHLHMPFGENTPEMDIALEKGAKIAQHKPGYNNVIISRAKSDAGTLGWEYIPFGMECEEAVEQTSRQVANIPSHIKRMIVPVGSGMSLAGILYGLQREGRKDIEIIGIIIGANPTKRLNHYAPLFWQSMVTLIPPKCDYSLRVDDMKIGNIPLDPIYEAKCIGYISPGDLFWIVGNRRIV